ncbi:primosomal protein N' [Subtercola endophyticus]|nr:primosomal protein N' [Subtercola endophyticus]UFS61097.1 primosomal protein N' [Subtercola endophyticus]
MLESPLPQLDRLFDYRIPDALVAQTHPGVRVKVPLRTAGRVSRGYVIDITDHADFTGNLSDIEEVVSAARVLTPEVWALARRAADRAAGTASDIVRLAVPPRQVRVEKAWLARRANATAKAASGDDTNTSLTAANSIDGHPTEPSTTRTPSPSFAEIVSSSGLPGVADSVAGTSRVPAYIEGYGAGVIERALERGDRIAVTAIPTVRRVADVPDRPVLARPRNPSTNTTTAPATTRASAATGPATDSAAASAFDTAASATDAKHPAPNDSQPPSATATAPGSPTHDSAALANANPAGAPLGTAWVGAWAATMAEMAVYTLGLGRSSILVVPDYRDQEQLETALRAALATQPTAAPAARATQPAAARPAPAADHAPGAVSSTGTRAAGEIGIVARLDARQTNPERYANFLACLDEQPRIVVGTRSAVYAPAHNLGLIALWDEADPLHEEPLSPYVSSRDVALIRQEQSGCALAFVSHSRSTEVQRLVELGFVDDIPQSRRYLPKVVPTSAQGATDAHSQNTRIPSSAWNIARTGLETGPVLIQVARPGYSPVLACASCTNPAHCLVCDGPLRATSRKAPPSCAWCGAIAAQWQCRHCEGTTFTHIGQGSTRTAEELGRAFPATRIIVSDGSRSLGVVGSAPALVVATRGAEPVAAGGYSAILLLDGERMLARESLTVAEDCLRWWSNAIALAAPRAPTVIVGVGGELARTLVTWQQPRFASEELADRRRLRFPPAVRVATVRGTPEALASAVRELQDSVHGEDSAKIDVLGPVPDASPDEIGFVRSIVRFDYSVGQVVASTLRSVVIKNATSRRKTPGRPTNYRTPPTLRVHFDDREILD